MNGNLAQFGEDLRLHLFRLEECLCNINGLLAGDTAANEDEFAERVERLRTTIRESTQRTIELHKMLQTGLERDIALSAEALSRWVTTRQTAHLHARADQIEQLAAAAAELAALSAMEAEQITMTAILARQQAIAVQVQRT